MSTQRESCPCVLYVVGAARSGSTVLQTVLGSHAQIEGVGELGFLSRSGHVFEEYCACGEPADVCPYWSEVRRVWPRYGGPHELAEGSATAPFIYKVSVVTNLICRTV